MKTNWLALVSVAVLLSLSGEADAGVRIEWLTGKLKIDSSYVLGGIEHTGGEINIYKKAGKVAGAYLTCQALDTHGLTECVKAALAKIESLVAKKMKLDP